MSAQIKSVLIVDDNFNIRSALRGFVEVNLGMSVCAAVADGSEALEKAKDQRPDLILMDLAMPVMNGLDAASAIKKAVPETRIVIFTLYSDTLGELLAKAAGIDLVVSKSEGATALLLALSLYLGQNSFSFDATDRPLSDLVRCCS